MSLYKEWAFTLHASRDKKVLEANDSYWNIHQIDFRGILSYYIMFAFNLISGNRLRC